MTKTLKRKLLTLATAFFAVCLSVLVCLGLPVKGSAETQTFSMQSGAAARLNTPYGIRFTADIPASEYDEEVTYGMLILPYDWLTKYEFNDDYVEVLEDIGVDYANFTCEPQGNETDGYTIQASLVGIKEANLTRNFIGIAYSVEGETYTYTEVKESNKRSIIDVMQAALASGEFTDDENATDDPYDFMIETTGAEAFVDGAVTLDAPEEGRYATISFDVAMSAGASLTFETSEGNYYGPYSATADGITFTAKNVEGWTNVTVDVSELATKVGTPNAVNKIIVSGNSLANAYIANVQTTVEYTVSTAEEFIAAIGSTTAGKYYILTKDIDMTEYITANPWTNGRFASQFSAILDGAGHKVTGFAFTLTADNAEHTKVQEPHGFVTKISGVWKNLYLEASFEIVKRTETLTEYIGDTLSGTLENCVFNFEIAHYTTSGGYGHAWNAPLRTIASTATIKDTVVIMRGINQGQERLLSHYFKDGATLENYVVVTENRDTTATYKLPSEVYSTRQEGLGNLSDNAITYYTSLDNAGSGVGEKFLPAAYKTGSDGTDSNTDPDANHADYWAATTKKINELVESVNYSNYTLTFEGRAVADMRKKISTAEEFIAALGDTTAGNSYVLTKDIDMTEYFAANPWQKNTSLVTKFAATIDGAGHKVTGIAYTYAFAEGSTEYTDTVRPYGLVGTFTGVWKNLYIEASFDIYHASEGLDSSFIAQSMQGKIENCVIKIEDVNTLKVSNKYNMAPFKSVASGAVLRDVLIIMNTGSGRFLCNSLSTDVTIEDYVLVTSHTGLNKLPLKSWGREPNCGLLGENAITHFASLDGEGKVFDVDAFNAGTKANDASYWAATTNKVTDIVENVSVDENGVITLKAI